jgi:hypothetical protein
MKYLYSKLKIRLSELHTQPVAVPVWEVPLLQAIHGESVSVGENIEVTRDEPVDPRDEFTRLANKYREPEPGQPPYVAAVYGAFGPGVNALDRAIQAAFVREDAPPADDFGSLLGETA